jgi:hypothetical protein
MIIRVLARKLVGAEQRRLIEQGIAWSAGLVASGCANAREVEM